MNDKKELLENLAKEACHALWDLRDIYKFKNYCSADVDIIGFKETDSIRNGEFGVNIFPFLQNTSLNFSIEYETYNTSYVSDSCGVVICNHTVLISNHNEQIYKKYITTLVFDLFGDDAKIINAHFSNVEDENNSYEILSNENVEPYAKNVDEQSAYYRELLISNCDLFIECEVAEYVLHYDKDAYQKLFDDDTFFTNPDRWFWHMCNTCVHPDDYEQLDIFRKVDIDKRIKNNISKIVTTFRIKNRKQGYIWVQLQLINKVNQETKRLEKTAMIFTQLDKSQFNEVEFLEKSRRDKLTDLYNRTYFEYLVNVYLKDYNPSATSAMILMDIDHFRLVNDTFGHLTGDVILCQFARSLMTFFGQDSLVGRISGDKFAVYIKNMPSKYEVTKAIDNFLKNIRHTHFELGTSLNIHSSAGIVFINDGNHNNINTIIDQSKSALAMAKDNGRNCYMVYQEENE